MQSPCQNSSWLGILLLAIIFFMLRVYIHTRAEAVAPFDQHEAY